MQRYNVREAKKHFSKLLNDVVEGQRVLITRNGVGVEELIPFQRRPFPLGTGRKDPLINREILTQVDWWRSMSDSARGENTEG